MSAPTAAGAEQPAGLVRAITVVVAVAMPVARVLTVAGRPLLVTTRLFHRTTAFLEESGPYRNGRLSLRYAFVPSITTMTSCAIGAMRRNGLHASLEGRTIVSMASRHEIATLDAQATRPSAADAADEAIRLADGDPNLARATAAEAWLARAEHDRAAASTAERRLRSGRLRGPRPGGGGQPPSPGHPHRAGRAGQPCRTRPREPCGRAPPWRLDQIPEGDRAGRAGPARRRPHPGSRPSVPSFPHAGPAAGGAGGLPAGHAGLPSRQRHLPGGHHPQQPPHPLPSGCSGRRRGRPGPGRAAVHRPGAGPGGGGHPREPRHGPGPAGRLAAALDWVRPRR